MKRNHPKRIKKCCQISTVLFIMMICTQTLAFQNDTFANPQTLTDDASKGSVQRKFLGEVDRGQDITFDIGEGLVFCLEASHDPVIEGWTIRILPKDRPRRDFAWQLNPPYRGYNSIHVNTTYGFTAKDAIQYNPRELRFPLNEADAGKAEELVEILLSTTGPQFNEAFKARETMPSGKAVFKITDARTGKSGAENGERGLIEWIKFELTVTFPDKKML